MGSKPKSTSSSASGSAQAWAQPYAKQGVSDITSVFNQNQPGINQLTQTVQGQIVPDLVQRFQQGGAAESAAKGYIGDVLGGKYLNSNPYLDSVIGATNRDVMNGVNSQFESAGRYGSGAYADELARRLSSADAGIRYGDYNNQMGRMDNAAGLGLTSGLSDAAQALSAIGTGAQVPYAGSSSYANALGALFNGGTEKSKQVGANPIWGAIGAGLGAAGMALGG